MYKAMYAPEDKYKIATWGVDMSTLGAPPVPTELPIEYMYVDVRPKLMVVLTDNDWDGYQFFNVSVQRDNEHNGRDILFSYAHNIPDEWVKGMSYGAVLFECQQLIKMLIALGANVEFINHAKPEEEVDDSRSL